MRGRAVWQRRKLNGQEKLVYCRKYKVKAEKKSSRSRLGIGWFSLFSSFFQSVGLAESSTKLQAAAADLNTFVIEMAHTCQEKKTNKSGEKENIKSRKNQVTSKSKRRGRIRASQQYYLLHVYDCTV